MLLWQSYTVLSATHQSPVTFNHPLTTLAALAISTFFHCFPIPPFSSVYLFPYPVICPSVCHLSPFIHLSIHPLLIHLLAYLSIHSLLYFPVIPKSTRYPHPPLTHSPLFSPTPPPHHPPPTHPPACSSIFTHLSIHLSICLSTHSPTHPSTSSSKVLVKDSNF